MRKPILIIYAPGAYGTFIEWLLTYLTDQTLDDQLPFGKSGNAHNFLGNQIITNAHDYYRTKDSHGKESLKKIDETFSHNKFYRIHPPSIEGEKSLFSCTISIIAPTTSALWIFRNEIEKFDTVEMLEIAKTNIPMVLNKIGIEFHDIERLRSYSDQNDKVWIDNVTRYLEQQHFKAYNVNRVEDLERWQVREIFSYQNINDIPGRLPGSKHLPHLNHIISVEDLRDQMPTVINDLIEKLELKVIPYRHEKLDWIWQEWKSRQEYANIDAMVDEYIKNVINGIDQTMPFSFNICEEILIQQKLREAGYEIKCNGLDSLPLRTIDLKELLHNA